MFRLSSQRGLALLHRQLLRKLATSPPTEKRGSGGRIFAFLLGSSALGASGTLAYAYYDPKFRKDLETKIPQLEPVLQQLLGEPRKPDASPPPSLAFDDLKKKASDALPKRKEEKPTPVTLSKPPAILSPTEKPPSKQIPLTEAKKIAQTEVDRELAKPRAPEGASAVIAARNKAQDDLRAEFEREIERTREAASAETRAKIFEARGEFEEDLRLQLQRLAAAHSEHLDEALKMQHDRFNIESEQRVRDALEKERAEKHREVMLAVARLEGIERALDGRIDLDKENRRAKELWLAAQRLQDAIIFGRKLRFHSSDPEHHRKPLANEIMTIKEAASPENGFVLTLVNALPDDAVANGVWTEEDLLDRFTRVKRLARRVAMIGENGGTLWQYFLSLLQSMFIFERRLSELDEIWSDADTFAIVDRANALLAMGDYEGAVKVMGLLKGESAKVAKDWIEDMRAHLESRQVARVLMAHASAMSVRTVY